MYILLEKTLKFYLHFNLSADWLKRPDIIHFLSHASFFFMQLFHNIAVNAFQKKINKCDSLWGKK